MRTTIGRNLAAMAYLSGAFVCLRVFELPVSVVGAVLFALLAVGTYFGGRRGASRAIFDFPVRVVALVDTVVIVFANILTVVVSLISFW